MSNFYLWDDTIYGQYVLLIPVEVQRAYTQVQLVKAENRHITVQTSIDHVRVVSGDNVSRITDNLRPRSQMRSH